MRGSCAAGAECNLGATSIDIGTKWQEATDMIKATHISCFNSSN